jgi:2,3-dihydroxybenzoate decarboxylase
MGINRRVALESLLALPISACCPAGAINDSQAGRPAKRVATEESFLTPELISATNRYMKKYAHREPGLIWLKDGFPSPERFRPRRQLIDFDLRLKIMDQSGIDMQIISLMQPGVQIFEPNEAIAISKVINDRIASIVMKHPSRLAALATIPPQAPEAAAKELERAIEKLGMKGAVINSHTKGEYLDNEKFWPIFAAAESLGAPIYLHPREPSASIRERCDIGGLHMIWGFAAETNLHALRLIVSGVFEKYPKLKIVLGHLGEGIPFYLERTDNRFQYMPSKYKESLPRKLNRRPSEYFRDNFVVTSSGQNWQPAVQFCQKVLGVENVLFGADYPFEDQAATVAQAEAIEMAPIHRELFFYRNAERIFSL